MQVYDEDVKFLNRNKNPAGFRVVFAFAFAFAFAILLLFMYQNSTSKPPLVSSEGDIIRLSTRATISNSIREFTGSISEDSNLLTVDGPHDFDAGEGIAIGNAGTYQDGWLRTTVTSVEGDMLVLAGAATTSASTARVHHDESEALQTIIRSLDAGSTLVFDVSAMNVESVKLSGQVEYDGHGCLIRTPLYANQDIPSKIHSVFSISNARHITIRNFSHDGGKTRGINGNDQFGTAFVISENASDVRFLDNSAFDNQYVVFRNLNEQTDILFKRNRITNTDVAINFMAGWKGTSRMRGITIEDNVVIAVDCRSEAIAIIPATYRWRDPSTGEQLAQLENVIIRGNVIDKPGRVALVYGGSIGRNILIENNRFIRSMIAISSYDGKIELLNENGHPAPELNGSDRTIIRNNDLGDTTYEQLRLAGGNITLDGNVFGTPSTSRSLLVGQDHIGTTGTFLVKNHLFKIGGHHILSVSDPGYLLSNLFFKDNSIIGDNGLIAIDFRIGSNITISGTEGATNLQCRVPAGSIVDAEDWMAVLQ